MAVKLYPPQIDGILPAFYKNYDKETGELKNAAIAIPFGMNRAVTIEEVYKLSLRIKTVSTNTIIDVRPSDSFDKTELIAYFTIPYDIAEKFNEGQFYKAQLAFINRNEIDGTEVIGYYSTVGTLKCVAKPTVTIAGYDQMKINTFIQEFIGEYQQDTNFGDSTEKVETYEFNLWDNTNTLVLSSGTLLHNSADDVSSSSSTDVFKINNEINQNELYYIQYTVTTLNNLTISSPLYKVMQGHSVDIQYPLKLRGKNNYNDGYIELHLEGELNADNTEKLCTGTFLITRGSEIDDYFEWNEIIKFNMEGKLPSNYVFRDFTVAQGIRYKYRIQQYNQYDLYSNPVYMTYQKTIRDIETGANVTTEVEYDILADFEDMFIYDGKRQLKVRFNPKVSSFKNTIPEQKIETIGSKYPFIFRSGHVNYKEFPVSGLISFNMDDAMLFLTETELLEAKLLEPTYSRRQSGHTYFHNYDNKDKRQSLYYSDGIEYNNKYLPSNSNQTYISYPAGVGQITNTSEKYWREGIEVEYSSNLSDLVMRLDKNLTTENLMSERYFKLKVLDWLTDGSVKLFRSPGEGNYLVRILNVSMTPTDSLGRMLHTFQGTCYEIDDLTYNNLIHYGIVTENVFALTEMHWGSIDINILMKQNHFPWNDFIVDDTKNPPIRLLEEDWHGYYLLPLQSQTVLGFECIDFAPGDKLWITYAGAHDDVYIVIGETGSYSYLFDDRIIEKIAFLPDPDFADFHEFTRIINYYYEGIQNRKFDTIKNVFSETQVCKQYVGPYENLFENYELYTYKDEEKIRLIEEGRQLINKININDIEWINWNNNFDKKEQELFLEVAEIDNFSDFVLLSQNEKIIILDNYAEALDKKIKEEKDLLNKCALIDIKEDYDDYSDTEDFQNIINDIKRHPNIILAENAGGNTIKFDTIQVEILQAFKRPLIPIFVTQGFNSENPSKNLKFSLTPFGTGYVNYNSIYDATTEDNLVKTVPDNVLQRMIEDNQIYIHQYDLENIDFVLANNELDSPLGGFDIYQVFIPTAGENEQILNCWQATNCYFDTYHQDWINEYDPTFSVNDLNESMKLFIPKLMNEAEQEITNIDFPLPTILLKEVTDDSIKEAEDYIIDYLSDFGAASWYHYTNQPENKYIIRDYNSFEGANNIDLSDIEEITVTHLGKVDKLRIGNGVVINLTFQLQIVDYAVEDDNAIVKGNKSDYLNKKDNYNKKLSDYFSIQTDTTQNELETDITELTEQIIELAENVDRHFINDETGELDIQTDENGVPIIIGSDDSNYQKIIDSAEAAKKEVVEAKPLKQQLILITNKCFNDMLRGWEDDRGISHYGLLFLHPFEFGELPDMTYDSRYLDPEETSDWFDYLVGDTYIDPILGEPITNDMWDISEDYWPNRRVPRNYATSNFPYPFKDALQYNGTDIERPDEEGNTINEKIDNSYSIFVPVSLSNNNINIDVKCQNVFYSLLFRIDKSQFINRGINNNSTFQFYDGFSIIPKTDPVIENRYTYQNGTRIDKSEDIQNAINNSHSLMEFIQQHQFIIDTFENFFNINEEFTLPVIFDLLNNIKNNYIDLLYLLAHSPKKNELTILNPFLFSQDISLQQNRVEDDWFNNNEEVLEFIQQLQIPKILKSDTLKNLFQIHIGANQPHGILEDYMKIEYLQYTGNKLDTAQIYYIQNPVDRIYRMAYPITDTTLYYKDKDDEEGQNYSYINRAITINNVSYPVYIRCPVYITEDGNEQITLNAENNNFYIDSITNTENDIIEGLQNTYLQNDIIFFNYKVGRFIEAKDDMDILLNDLLVNYLIPYYKASLFDEILRDEKEKIPANVTDYTVEKYLEYLTNTIASINTSIETWKLVYKETSDILNDDNQSLDEEKREELEELRSTAKYNQQIKEIELQEITDIATEFKDLSKNGPYAKYQKAKALYEAVHYGIYEPLEEKCNAAFNLYKEARDIYLIFVDLLKDLFTKGYEAAENDETTAPLYINTSADVLTEYIKEYTDRLSEYIDIYNGDGTEQHPGYKVDLLNNNSKEIEIPMGYFQILKLLDNIDNEITNDNISFNLNTYKNIIQTYTDEAEALKQRYNSMVTEINEIVKIYCGRATFIKSLDSIIAKYTELIDEGKTELRKLVNRLQKLKNNLLIITDENAPTTADIDEIWVALAKYLLCLEKYYIQEVERRYES